MLFLCVQTNAQFSKKTLDNIYNDNLTHKLDSFLNQRYEVTKAEYTKNSNDTLRLVSMLLNKLFSNNNDKYDNQNYRYIILQENCKVIKIDTMTLFFDVPVFLAINSKVLKPIKYDNQIVNAIWGFIGPNAYESITVNEYMYHKDKLKKQQIKKAEAIIAMRKEKLKFVEKFISLPYTWGQLTNSLVPYTINSIVFNKEMTEVRISYYFTYRGGDITYKLINDKWVKGNLNFEWIH